MENPDVVIEIKRNEHGQIIGFEYKNNSREKDDGKSGIDLLEFMATCLKINISDTLRFD